MIGFFFSHQMFITKTWWNSTETMLWVFTFFLPEFLPGAQGQLLYFGVAYFSNIDMIIAKMAYNESYFFHFQSIWNRKEVKYSRSVPISKLWNCVLVCWEASSRHLQRWESYFFLILMLGTPCLVLWNEGFCLVDDIKYVLFCLPGLRENRRHPAAYLVHGAKALNNAFRTWTRKEVRQNFILSVIIILGIIPSLAFTAELNI